MLYFKFTQSSHAVIFCTAVFVLPVSSHVVISRAFQGPPLKVRAHNTTSSDPSSSTASSSSSTLMQIRPPNRLKFMGQNNPDGSDGSPPLLSPLFCSFHFLSHFLFSHHSLTVFTSSLRPFLPSELCFESELGGNSARCLRLPNTEY